MERSQQAAEPSMDEILASIRKIIADDPAPVPSAPASSAAPASTVNRATGSAGRAPTPVPGLSDGRTSADIDRDLADLLGDESPAGRSAPIVPGPSASGAGSPDQRLSRPGWLTAGPPPGPGTQSAAAAPGPFDAGRPTTLADKLDRARPEVSPVPAGAAAAPLPRGDDPSPVPSPGARIPATSPLPAVSAAPVAPAPSNLAPSSPATERSAIRKEPVQTGPTVEIKPAAAVAAGPASPALTALANLAKGSSAAAAHPGAAATEPSSVPALPPTPDVETVVQPAPKAVSRNSTPPTQSDGVKPPAAPVGETVAPAPAKPAAAALPAPAATAALSAVKAETVLAALPMGRSAPGAAEAPVRSVDDLIAELLRPMLRQWLDENMPRILEKALRIELAQGLKLPAMPGSVVVADKSADKA